MPTFPTGVRAGRRTALLVGLQSAKGSAVSNFTAAATGRVWTNDTEDQVAPEKSSAQGWMLQSQMETAGRYNSHKRPAGGFACKATPFSLEMLLRSNWGSFAGGAFTLAGQVSEWMTLGWVESTLSGATEFFHRVYDAWPHRLTLRASPFQEVEVGVEYAAESDFDPIALNALGGITLPSSPMLPGDMNVFPGRLVQLFRDPTGANQEFDLHEIFVRIDQNLQTEIPYDMFRGVAPVWKAGHPGPLVTVEFVALVSIETWVIMTNSRAGTKQRYRFKAAAQAPAKTFQIDFYEMDFQFERLGHVGNEYVAFRGRGTAHRDSAGNFVNITLT